MLNLEFDENYRPYYDYIFFLLILANICYIVVQEALLHKCRKKKATHWKWLTVFL